MVGERGGARDDARSLVETARMNRTIERGGITVHRGNERSRDKGGEEFDKGKRKKRGSGVVSSAGLEDKRSVFHGSSHLDKLGERPRRNRGSRVDIFLNISITLPAFLFLLFGSPR